MKSVYIHVHLKIIVLETDTSELFYFSLDSRRFSSILLKSLTVLESLVSCFYQNILEAYFLLSNNFYILFITYGSIY
jgi:hypothetical protein